MKDRKVLVAGGTGLVGANLLQRLHALGADVKATFHTHEPTLLRDRFVQADCTDPAACVRETQGMQDLIVCAAYSSGIEDMRKRPAAGILPNVLIQANLLEAARINGVERVVVLSSSTLYQTADHPIREDELDLNQPPHEAYQAIGNVYRFIEQLCYLYQQRFGLKIGLLRPSSIYGPFDHFEPGRSHVLPALIRRALSKETPFRVWGSPDVVRDFVYVDDVVQAILDVLERHCVCDPVNVGLGQGVTIGETVRLILELCGHPAAAQSSEDLKTSGLLPHPAVEYDVSQPTAIPYRVLDTHKLESMVGAWKKTELREGVRRTIMWYEKMMNDE